MRFGHKGYPPRFFGCIAFPRKTDVCQSELNKTLSQRGLLEDLLRFKWMIKEIKEFPLIDECSQRC